MTQPITEANVSAVYQYLRELQNNICQSLEGFESRARFETDNWIHREGFEGCSKIIENGGVFEKGGVNFSRVEGERLPMSALPEHLTAIMKDKDQAFEAMGVSLVIHPLNPYVPTTHANFRFFRLKHHPEVWWFGGGFDLTPYYGFTEDCRHWHAVAQAACQPYGEQLYSQYKKSCDDYFYLKHRDEHRGIGGLFFDYLFQNGFEDTFAFVKSCGDHFMKAYGPIVEKRHTLPYGVREQSFQHFRRGRYVEFNLLFDRGTKFGIESSGRTESILMSLPPRVTWHYQVDYPADSREGRLVSDYLIPRDWVSETSVLEPACAE